MKKIKWYDPTKLINTKSDVNLIIGQRSNGKTFGILKYFLTCYKKDNSRFCYIRRWSDDLKGFRAEQLFTPLQSVIESLFGEHFTVVYYRHKYYLVNPAGEKIDCIGYALALSEASHTKSVAYTGVGRIVFDEFIQMAGEATLRDEMSKYETTLSSVIRINDCVVFLLANTVSKFSPYFAYYGIDINKVEQGSIVTKEYPLDDERGMMRVSLEYCEYNPEIGNRSSRFARSKMITTGQWEIPETSDIPSVLGEVVKERLLCSIYDPEADITIGCFVRTSKWVTIEKDEDSLLYTHQEHIREFLVLKVINYRSHYFHLSDQKSLDYHTYNDISYFLADILDGTEINIEHELYMGRIFSDNMFTADYFNHAWNYYSSVAVRRLL